MKVRTVNKILADTAYARTGGNAEELRCVEYLRDICSQMGFEAVIEPFAVPMYCEKTARLLVDGKEIECKGYFGSASGTVSARLQYLEGNDKISLKRCKDKIVLVDKPVGYKLYDALIANGAVGFISFNGDMNTDNRDIDRREIRFMTEGERLIPGVNIHVSDAVEIVRAGCESAEITVEQDAYTGNSHNLILDIAGECQETVIVSAHYDSTLLSNGAYDNMSGCIALLYLAEYFSRVPHKRRIRLLWCGSEERGLLGSKAYCQMHANELEKVVLNINLDMLGSVLGGFVAFSCANEETVELLEKFIVRHHFPATVRYAIRSSDSNSFVYSGVPAVSFARYAPNGTWPLHTRYDTALAVSAKRILGDSAFVAKFTEYIANAEPYPVSREISEKIKADVDAYMERKKQ